MVLPLAHLSVFPGASNWRGGRAAAPFLFDQIRRGAPDAGRAHPRHSGALPGSGAGWRTFQRATPSGV